MCAALQWALPTLLMAFVRVCCGDRWQGYIKDYDGGTLMECVLHPKISYTRFPDFIAAQRSALDARVRQVSNSHIIYKVRLLTHTHTHARTHTRAEYTSPS